MMSEFARCVLYCILVFKFFISFYNALFWDNNWLIELFYIYIMCIFYLNAVISEFKSENFS